MSCKVGGGALHLMQYYLIRTDLIRLPWGLSQGDFLLRRELFFFSGPKKEGSGKYHLACLSFHLEELKPGIRDAGSCRCLSVLRVAAGPEKAGEPEL